MALALGSGGARGYAHIGVIEVLAERGYDVVGIAGSSMGAMIGGLQAAGAQGPISAFGLAALTRGCFVAGMVIDQTTS